MSSIIAQVQKLISQSRTAEALEVFTDWLNTQKETSINEVIVLRSRYEQVERDKLLNIISSEEAARAMSQINYSLLQLAQNTERNTFELPTTKQTSSNSRIYLLIGSVAVLILAFFIVSRWITNSSNVLPAEEQSKQNDSDKIVSDLPKSIRADETAIIQFPQSHKAALTSISSTVTYTILEGKSESYNPENQKITLKIRAQLSTGSSGMNFWESSFRLFVNDLPYAAQGGLNEVVESESFKDGEVYFLIPKTARNAVLKLKFYDQETILPMRW